MTEIKVASCRELDALVAEHVMGWVTFTHEGISYLGTPSDSNLNAEWEPITPTLSANSLPHYSTLLDDCWVIVEAFRSCSAKGLTGKQKFYFYGEGIDDWHIWIGLHRRVIRNPPLAQGRSPEIAICLAALRFLGLDVSF